MVCFKYLYSNFVRLYRYFTASCFIPFVHKFKLFFLLRCFLLYQNSIINFACPDPKYIVFTIVATSTLYNETSVTNKLIREPWHLPLSSRLAHRQWKGLHILSFWIGLDVFRSKSYSPNRAGKKLTLPSPGDAKTIEYGNYRVYFLLQ